MNLSSINVRFTADTSNFSSAINRMKQETGGLTSGIKSMLGSALSFAAGAAIFNLAGDAMRFLGDQFRACLDESNAAAAELAQTNAVLASTHDVSKMTAAAVLDLADHFSHLTMFTDDTVQMSENLLLTFTNIGQNIFPQATQAVLDMSQAMGQDWKTSAIQIGKALQDPILGLTALRRVGVSFTEEQKKMIKGFMATGDVLDAQKIILGELNREFGNSAIAAGKTLPGQLKILGQNFDDVRQTIGDAVQGPLKGFVALLNSQVVPALKTGAKWVADFLSAMSSKAAQKALSDLGQAFSDLGGAINNIIAIFLPFGINIGTAKDAAHNFSLTIEKVAGFIKGIADAINNAKPTILAIKDWLEEAAKKGQKAWLDLQPAIKKVGDIITTVGNFLQTTFAPAWKQLQDTLVALKPQWDAFVKSIGPALPGLKILGQIIGGVVVLALMAFVKWVAMMATGAVLAFGLVGSVVLAAGLIFNKIMTGISDNVKKVIADWNTLKHTAAVVWAAVMKAISDAVETGKKWVQDKFNTIIKWISDAWTGIEKAATTWGTTIINNLLAALQAAWTNVVTWFNGVLDWLKGLWPGSPVEHGPLVGYENWGYVLAQGIAGGLMRGTPLVQSAMAGLLGAASMSGGGLNLGISHSFSGPGGIASSFGGGGQPVIINHVHVHVDPSFNLDGRELAEGIGPHLVRSIQLQTGHRRPA